MSGTLDVRVCKLGEKNQMEELRELIRKTSIKELTTTLKAKLSRSDCINFWNYLLLACDANNVETREKRFACVRCFLDGLRTVEMSYKLSVDLITRLHQDLSTYSSDELNWILEHCLDDMRAGDAKCVAWKDLLPETLLVLIAKPRLVINGIAMAGNELRDSTVRNLCTMRWPSTILTPIADMFIMLKLSYAERVTVLNKFAGALQELSPMELPALCYQLFSMCNSAAQLIIPLLALEKYFHRNYYKRLFLDMCSNSTDFDSIDAYSDKELREAEETVLHHLNYCTMYLLSEQHVAIMLRNFLHMPDVILTPFMLSAIISMTAVNRDPESARSSSCILLPFLRNVIKHNEDERTLADYSVWCRDTLQRQPVDLLQVFTVLIDQNKDGKDVITPGLVNLAFTLLKTHNSPKLNTLAITFLTNFIRRRFMFGQGIIKRVAEWMVVDQEQNQFSECLTMLSVADTYTVSECLETITTVMEDFLWLPGEQSMRMMNFILPLLKLSNRVRDALIDVLRKAMTKDFRTRRMAIFGFCMILKQLNNSNSVRQSQNASSFCTQHNISGYSMMTQSSLGNRSNPQRNFDMLTLEIIGILRSCFDQQLDIRRTLYENLQRAVELNAKLVPHVLQFVDFHLRSFFDTPPADEVGDDLDTRFSVNYELLLGSKDEQVELKDNLGCLVQFVSHCLTIFERAPSGCDVREMQRLLTLCTQRLVANRLHLEDTSPPVTHLKCARIQQELNLIEGLISHSLLCSKPNNDVIKQILPLFKQHQKLLKGLQSLADSSKKTQKHSKQSTTNDSTVVVNVSVTTAKLKQMCTQPENIWDLTILEKLLHLLHDDLVPFASAENTTQLRSFEPLVRYVLEITAQKVHAIREEPDYKQLSYSKRTLKLVTDITKVIYERCILRLPDLWRDFDLESASLAAKCFMECVRTAHETYAKRFKEFVKGFDMATINRSKEGTYVLQGVLDQYMKEDASNSDSAEALSNDKQGAKLPVYLLEALEILYDHIGYGERAAIDSYTWLLEFCQTWELRNPAMGVLHRMLFAQRQKTHSGPFFDAIARQLGQVLGTQNDEDVNQQSNFGLKTLDINTTGSCLQYMYAVVQKQLEDVDYFIIKANNLKYKCNIVPESDRVYYRGNLETLEGSICTQLILITRTLLELTNVCIPLGSHMDGLMKLLIQLYTCLKNLARHYLVGYTADASNGKSIKFEQLLKNVGKPLSANIYQLISYVEYNILDDQSKEPATKRKPQAERAKVLRETRLIPKVILAIENFNKHIILLSKKAKTNDRLANYLHFGAVRDFNIKSGDLKAVIERTYSHSSQIEVSDSNIEAVEDEEEGEQQQEPQKPDSDDEQASSIAEPNDDDEEEERQPSKKQQETTRKPQRRRRAPSNEAEESQPKRRRGRPSKK
ncbi:Fanconi anemia group I protein [Drosophila innubila]|uniref:Fanconi anemia group I protein n=1 Tax=Drosophila innubila TaxID=198719 RepID=UPI00148CADCE|nr:Fanconi anemia group I protein [Drosophila innubila]